ncbi:alpha/beta hydrolase [Nocardioides campestrisoli]|uniref:alpha/beta hydrolase n=1 Tax=Nocardioides campestrisoli TaxID=2736757 RepID=UPI0015E764ED|nr:alpha/beta fold hydrolase [Nocardioides campestrisoli]
MNRRRVLASVLVAGVVVALAGWAVAPRAQQWWKLSRSYAPNSPLSDQCGDAPSSARRVVLTADDETRLGAAEIGPADAGTGVVLRYGASQTLCDWLPWAEEVAAATGVRVLVFDRRGRGASPAEESLTEEPADTVAAVRHLRGSGAQEVALVGSSMGNSVTLSALPLLGRDEAPCALVAISPVLTSADERGRLDGSAADPLPAATWVTWETQGAGVSASAELLAARAVEQGSALRELGVDTADHSRQLVATHPEAAELVIDAVASCS